MGKTGDELLVTTKRSARLEAKKSTLLQNEKEFNSKKNDLQKHVSGKIQTRELLKKRNDSKENNSDYNKVKNDYPPKNNSTDDPKTRAVKSAKLTESRKQSARLKIKKSMSSKDKKQSILVKNEPPKLESGDTRRSTRLGKRNTSKECDLDDKKSESEDSQRDNSTYGPKKVQNKFFKSKTFAFDSEQKVTPTQKKEKEKNVEDSIEHIPEKKYVVPPSLKQITLSESFSRGSKFTGRLRARKNAKDNKESSNGSIVLDESKEKESRENKEPIYRAASKLSQVKKITEDKDSIYDFEFDVNDPQEKPTKNKNKKKKKYTRKPAVRKKKRTNPLIKDNNNEPIKGPEESYGNDLILAEDGKELPKPADVISTEENNTDGIVVPTGAEALPQSSSATEIVKENSPCLRISSVEILKGKRMISFKPDTSLSRSNSAKFNPFKPKTILNSQNMMDHSLLNKSLSPIKSYLETFDPASPWRPPLPGSFSSVKQVVQSTPQAKRNIQSVKATLGFGISQKEGKNVETKTTIKKSPNPLGNNISSTENILASNLKINELNLNNQESNSSLLKFETGKKPLSYGENKENLEFGDRLYLSPKKNGKAVGSESSPVTKKRNNPLLLRVEASKEDENSMPAEEPISLKQSNLNEFLNLEEMPESIVINTSHGIFGDGNSTTSVLKSQNLKTQAQQNIENCFGFEEDCCTTSDVENSPVIIKSNKKIGTNIKRKTFDRLKRRDLFYNKDKRPAARISLGEIKNTVYPRGEQILDKMQRTEEVYEKKELDFGNDGETEVQKTEKKSKDMSCPAHFIDTFDVLSENGLGEGDDKSVGNEIALFADLEPIHFTQPPRWSYVKKRERKQDSSSEEDDDEDLEVQEKPVLKKRRLVKPSNADEKKINEWVKSVNETFQEIDEFDLVVEKLS